MRNGCCVSTWEIQWSPTGNILGYILRNTMREIIFAWGKLWERLDEVPTLVNVNVKNIWRHRTFWSTTDAHASCHLPPFSQALIAAAYVMIVACMDCCIDNDKKANAFCHSPPFLGLGASDEIKTSIGTLTKFLKHAARNPFASSQDGETVKSVKIVKCTWCQTFGRIFMNSPLLGGPLTIGSTVSIRSFPQTFRLWSKDLKCWNDGVVGNNIALPRFKTKHTKIHVDKQHGFYHVLCTCPNVELCNMINTTHALEFLKIWRWWYQMDARKFIEKPQVS